MKIEKVKIKVRPISANFRWGVYGFCEKAIWEDLEIFYKNDVRIGGVCLNCKTYLKDGLENLKEKPEEKEFAIAIEKYLSDNKCHYWYYYNNEFDEDFYEVPYNAPKNEKGEKPRFTDIWHPDKKIGISTVITGIQDFARVHLNIFDCEVEIFDTESYETSLKSFEENEKTFGEESKLEITFSDELIAELSTIWKKSEEEVLSILKLHSQNP